MERSVHPQRTLSKQAEFDEDEEIASVVSTKENNTICETKSPDQHTLINNNSIHRSRSQSKVKLLVRSHAVCEETSPPPDIATPPGSPPATPVTPVAPASPTNNDINNTNSNNCSSVSNNNSLTVTRHKLRRDGSSQGSIESNSWSPSNSRANSTEQYTDSTGVDLEQFIADTLNRNQKDRMLLLKIEHDLVNLAKDSKKNIHKFPPMSSYQRMLVHRVAAYFGMEHNVDPGGHSVVVNTTKATRIPDSRFKQHLRDDLLFPEEPRKSILKRDSASFEETGSFKSLENGDPRRSKSFEEREEEYEKVRRRIFNRNEASGSFEELGWNQDPAWISSDSENSSTRHRANVSDRSARLLKVESYESKDTLRANSLRLTVSKSYSFGGYDQSQPTTRILTKTDSGSSMSSRLSPSSSGYKSQSQRSDTTMSATPSPTATPHPHLNQISSQSGEGALSPDLDQLSSETTVVWAVTNITAVPPGSVLINPQTGQPFTNSDGSVYHFDPDNPPKVEAAVYNVPAQNNTNNNNNNTNNNNNNSNNNDVDSNNANISVENSSNTCSSRSSSDSAETAEIQDPPSPTTKQPKPPTPPPPSQQPQPQSPTHSQQQEQKQPLKQQQQPRSHPQQQLPPPSQSQDQPVQQFTRQQDFTPASHVNNLHSLAGNSSQNMNVFKEAEKFIHNTAGSAPVAASHYSQQTHQPATSSPLALTHHPSHYPMPAPVYAYPPSATTYNLVLQHQPPCPCPESPYRSNQQPPPPTAPLIYTSTAQAAAPPAPPHPHTFDHIIPEFPDLSGYMLGLNLDGSRNPVSHNSENRTAPPVIYWPHPQMPQGQNKALPVYYGPASSQVSSPRYPPPPAPAYQHLPPDRPGINSYNGSECNITYPHTALHMYYPQCNSASTASSQATPSWSNGASGNNGTPLVTLQYPPAPTPQQNLCANVQYAMYNSNGVGYGVRLGGCYQYPGGSGSSNPQPPLPLPQIYRPSNLQVGRGSGGTRGSPGVKEMNDFGAHLPVYGLRVLQGNSSRLSFALPSNGVKPVQAHHMRKQRPNSGRPILMASRPPAAQHPLSQTGYLMSTVAP